MKCKWHFFKANLYLISKNSIFRFLYALFSGNVPNSQKVTELALKTVAASILCGQVHAGITENQIINVVKQSFRSVEKEYMNNIEHLLTRKAELLSRLPSDLSEYEKAKRYKPVLGEVIEIHDELSAGASCVLALIYKSNLYIGNIGASKALLCKNDDNNVLRVTQLTVDHDLFNPDEEQRIKSLGLDIASLKQDSNFLTRCIGNYHSKGGYKDSTILSGAREAPVLSEPEIVGPIPVDGSCRFLILMSKGLCKTLTDIFESDSSKINKEIVQMSVEQFRSQTNLMGVAQSVVNKISLQHHDAFMENLEEGSAKGAFDMREDCTFLIRNFNYPLPNAPQKRSSQSSRSISDTSSTIRSDTSGTNSNMDYIENGKLNLQQTVKPYVDFSDYFKRVEEAKKNGTLPSGIEFD